MAHSQNRFGLLPPLKTATTPPTLVEKSR